MWQLRSTLALFLILASFGLQLSSVEGRWQYSTHKEDNNCIKMIGAPCNKAGGDIGLRRGKLWYYPPSPQHANGSHPLTPAMRPHPPPPPPCL